MDGVTEFLTIMMGSTHLLDACEMHVILLMVMRVAELRTEL